MNFKADNYIKSWFKRCLFALLILTFCRILFILYLNSYLRGAPMAQLPKVFLAGVLFDIQALVYALGLFHLFSLIPPLTERKAYQVLLKVFFTLGVGTIILLNFIDLEFFKIKTRRSGIELFYLLNDKSNPVGSYIYHYWWITLLFLLSLAALIYFYPRHKPAAKPARPLPAIVWFLVISAFLVLGARGGFYTRPLRSFDAARFVDTRWVSATINSPTQLLTSYSSAIPPAIHYMSDEECIQIVRPVKTAKLNPKIRKKPNIVLIILESFGRDYCGFLMGRERYTPFLDELAQKSIVFENAYSCGTTSMESVPAIFASIPSLLEVPYINSNFQNNNVHGLHYYLSKSGYNCSFYYGAENGSMGFDNFLRISGDIRYYGRNEYPSRESDYDGSWGIWDEPYLQYFVKEVAQMKQPFFTSVFTLTSHDPYRIPSQYASVFKGGELPIYKAVQYTDYALRQFFRKAETQPWFNNTIFVITADHPSHSVSEYFYTPSGKYEIPIMLYSPKLIKPARIDSITVSQLDIMPTILEFGQVKEPFFAMGGSLLDTLSPRTAINKDYGVAQLIRYPYCLRLFHDGTFIMHEQAKNVPNEDIRYVLTPAEQELQKQMETELKAKLQLYNNSLLNNHYRFP